MVAGSDNASLQNLSYCQSQSEHRKAPFAIFFFLAVATCILSLTNVRPLPWGLYYGAYDKERVSWFTSAVLSSKMHVSATRLARLLELFQEKSRGLTLGCKEPIEAFPSLFLSSEKCNPLHYPLCCQCVESAAMFIVFAVLYCILCGDESAG